MADCVRSMEVCCAAVGRVAAWVQLPLIAIIVFDVFSRRFMSGGSVALQELEWHANTVLFLFTMAYAYQTHALVRIDIVRQRFSPRACAWVELAGSLFFLLPFVAVVLYFSTGFVANAWNMGEVSDAPGGLPHRWLIKASLPLAFSLLFLQGCAVLLRQLATLFSLEPRLDRDG